MPAVSFQYISTDLAQGEDMRQARQRLNPQRPKRRRTRTIVLCVLAFALLGAVSNATEHPAHAAPSRDAKSVHPAFRQDPHLYIAAILHPGHKSSPIATECAFHTRRIIVADYHSGIRLNAAWNRAHDEMVFGHRPVTFDGLTFRNKGGRTVFTLVVC